MLHTTAHHSFWDASTGRWVDAAKLIPGKSMVIGPDGQLQQVTAVRNFTGAKLMRDLTVATTHTYYVIAGTTPVLVHNCELSNDRPLAEQKIELDAAEKRGVSPTILGPGAGVDELRAALGDATDFKWAVTMNGELKVMPSFAGGGAGEWPRIEIAHTVLAGLGGKLKAAGSGSYMEGLPVFINRWSGHFKPPAKSLSEGEAAFTRAGIDFFSSVLLE